MPTTAQTYIIGNWKMNGTGASLAAIDAIAARSAENGRTGPSLAICPPATLIERAAARAGVALAIGGQDCAPAPSGAHTGDLSAEMLRDAGARLVIVGHSERRADHGETDDIVRSKAEAALRAGLTAVVCVGETRAQRDAGDAEAVVGAQLGGSLPAAAGQGGVIVAYEPVWAIGTGLVAHERDIAAMHGFIREQLRAAFGTAGLAISILYGGSVKPDNARSILAVEEVNGALVGGASLKPEDFLAIAEAARA